jgi:hypothetical protein
MMGCDVGADVLLHGRRVGEDGGDAGRHLAQEAAVEGAELGCLGGHCDGVDVRGFRFVRVCDGPMGSWDGCGMVVVESDN